MYNIISKNNTITGKIINCNSGSGGARNKKKNNINKYKYFLNCKK